jgi:hypothetical protein
MSQAAQFPYINKTHPKEVRAYHRCFLLCSLDNKTSLFSPW